MHSAVAQIALRRVVLQVAVASKDLQGIVANLEARVGSEALGHGTVYRGVGVLLVQHRSGRTYHQPRARQSRRHVGELELQMLKVREGLAELLAHEHMLASQSEASVCCSQAAGTNVDSTSIEALHRNAESVTLLSCVSV